MAKGNVEITGKERKKQHRKKESQSLDSKREDSTVAPSRKKEQAALSQ